MSSLDKQYDRRMRAIVFVVLALAAAGWGVYNSSSEVRCGNVTMSPGDRCVDSENFDPGPDDGRGYEEMASDQRRTTAISFGLAGLFTVLATWQFIASFTGESSRRSSRTREGRKPEQRLHERDGAHEVVVRLSGRSRKANKVEYGLVLGAQELRKTVSLPWEARFRADSGNTVRVRTSNYPPRDLDVTILVDGEQIQPSLDDSRRASGAGSQFQIISCEYRIGDES